MNVGTLFAKLKLDTGEFDSGLDRAKSSGDNAASAVQNSFSRMSDFVRNSLSTAAGVLTANVLGGIGEKFKEAIGAGFGFNNSMEIVTAQLNAFTKDGAKSAEILDMIKDRAAKTPFEFEAMAKAATSLLPTSKASGAALEELIAKAEILAASNPAEGLEGAAFALKEAVGGDFLSLIERFNLPKKFINDLKQKGVPDLEIVQLAMKELGLDADLVGNLANTASGRWSTFKDTLVTLASTITGPVFEAFSGAMAQINAWFEQNQGSIQAFADALATKVAGAVQWLAETAIPAMVQAWNDLQPAMQTAREILDTIVDAVTDFITVWNGGEIFEDSPIADWGATIQTVKGYADQFVAFVSENLTPILAGIGAMVLAVVVPAFVTWAGTTWAQVAAQIALAAAMLPTIAAVLAIGVAVGVLFKAWTEDWGGIRTTITTWWEGTGRPIFDMLRNWLAVVLTQALQRLTEFWNTVLWPVLKQVGAWLVGTLFPVLADLAVWLKDTLVAAALSLADFWTGTLWPALQKVWAFLDANIIPILRVLANTWIALLKTEIRLLSELWTNVLWPALQKVWAFIDQNIVPIFRDLAEKHFASLKLAAQALVDLWNGTFYPAIQKIAGILGGDLQNKLSMVKQSFGYIRDAVGWVIDKLEDFQSYLDSIEIPDWLQGHSPPPLADWFRYISEDLGRVNLELPIMVGSLRAAGGAAAGLAGATDNSRSITIGSVTQVNQNASGVRTRSLSDELAGLQSLTSRL